MATITGLLPGDKIQLQTNYSLNNITWETLDCETPIITPSGVVNITTNSADKCFGGLDCKVRATLNDTSGCNIGGTEDIRIIVNPTFPTPDLCGPNITKWQRLSKDFRVLVNEFEGGCDETHVRNKVPVIRWQISYQGLRNIQESEASRSLICPGCQHCRNNTGGCVVKGGVDNYAIVDTPYGECLDSLRTSNRLDDFWNMVYGTYKRFTLFDHDTGEIWYNVRFEDNLEHDHINRRTSHSRSYMLVWKPCCSSAPLGGTCSSHGMRNYERGTATDPCCTFQE